MIYALTGGDACYGQPVNTIGILLGVACLFIVWEAMKWSWRN